ncbi:hypothetical protein JCM14076_24660 [Methylosoma difficile]
MRKNSPLTLTQQAQLFAQLKNLEVAGLPAFQACALLLQTEPALKKPLLQMQSALKLGQPIAAAGYRAGLFTSSQFSLVQAAESSGRLAEVYGHLAVYYADLASRVKKAQSRLYLPAFMLAASLFIQPLPALVTNQISLGGYALSTVGRLLLIGGGVGLLVKLPVVLTSLGAEAAWHRLQLRVPLVAGWLVTRQLNEFFFLLALMLEAGLAFSDALPKAIASIKNSQLRAGFKATLAKAKTGASVYETLALVAVIKPSTLQIINSSEQSGKLAQGMYRFSQLEAQNIGLQDDALAEWLPRLVYGAVAGWMAYSLLASPVATVVPVEF